MASYSRSSYKKGPVSVGGTVLNSLSSGFSLDDSIGEPVDDSIGAKANSIRLYLETSSNPDENPSEAAFSDNGKGMNKEQLGESSVMNNRSEKASNEKRGRFGNGRHNGCIALTRAQYPTTTFSKCVENENVRLNVVQLTTDWPEMLKNTGTYIANPHGLESAEEAKWLKYAVDPKKTGTVTVNPCPKDVFAKLVEKATTDDITKSMIFLLGRANFEPIEKGLNLSVIVDGVVKSVRPYNPIPLDKVLAGNKEMISMKVYKQENTEKYIATFPCKGVVSYLQFGLLDKKGNKKRLLPVAVDKDLLKDYQFRGDIKITHAWMQNWEATDYEIIGSGWVGAPDPAGAPLGKDGTPKKHFTPEVSALLNGRFIKRGDKIIAHHAKPAKKNGTKSTYDYYNYVRQMLEFSAEELDDEFGTQVNKAKIEERLIPEAIIETCNKLRDWFARDLHKRDYPNAQDDSDDAASVAESVASTRIVTSRPAVTATVASKPLVPAMKAPTVAQNIPLAPVIASIVAAAASETATATPAQAPAPPAQAPAPPAQAAPMAVNTQTPVTGHMRSTSKSEKEVLQRVVELAEKIMSSPNIEERLKNVSNTAKPGLTALFKSIDEIYGFLLEVDVEFEE
jgi:cell pole-organizing protein PopZ